MQLRIQSADGTKQPKIVENIQSVLISADNGEPLMLIVKQPQGVWTMDVADPQFHECLKTMKLNIRRPEVIDIDSL